jgi:hypothetical protein
MRARLAAALLFASIPLADAQAMTVAEFLQRSEALKDKGALALFSSDLGLLKKEVTTAAEQLRAERLAAQRAGRKPAYCPKTKAAQMDSDQLLAVMRAVPAGERPRLQVKDALQRHFARTHPCA